MDVDLKHHPWFLSLCAWTSSIPKRSPLLLLCLTFSAQQQHHYPHITHALMGNCCKNGNYAQLFNCFQPALCAFLQICIFFSLVFKNAYPPRLSLFGGKGRSKENNKKKALLALQGFSVAVSICCPLKWVHERNCLSSLTALTRRPCEDKLQSAERVRTGCIKSAIIWLK